MLDKLPAGYAYYRTEDFKLLALPQPVVEEAMAAAAQRHALDGEAKVMAKTAEMEREATAEVAAAEIRKLHAETASASLPAPGFHRVLPRLAEMTGARATADINTRSADSDVQDRLEALRKRMLELGPDRRIASPDNWREALDAMQEALPNFRDPIALLRDTLALGEVASNGVRIPPMLLLGPPGIGKTLFSHKVAELFGVAHGSIAFDQPSYGTSLRGLDKAWSNSESGLLFKLVVLGEFANPVILLDELDKSALGGGRREIDPLAQLHGALEPQTARCIQDISTDIEFDASLVTYVATANSLRGLEMPLLSRFDIFDIPAPTIDESVSVAKHVMQEVLKRLGVTERVSFDRRCAPVLARASPRLMQRIAERLVAQAVREQRDRVTQQDAWSALGLNEPSSLH